MFTPIVCFVGGAVFTAILLAIMFNAAPNTGDEVFQAYKQSKDAEIERLLRERDSLQEEIKELRAKS